MLDRYPQPATRPEPFEATFVKNGQLVSVMTSPRRFVGAISSLPTTAVDRRARTIGYLLIPIGAASGLALALAALYLGRQRLGLPNILRGALRHDEFFLVYQPIVDLDSGRWCGAEALIRWRRPDGELVQPDLFVPIAERCLNSRFTEHVIDLVARDLAAIAEHPHFYLSVNVTAADLERPETVELFRKLIVETNAPPDVITIEATERSPLNQEATGAVIRDLHQLGIRVVIDDFGTGYSTLSYLRTLDVAALKIDKSFVETLGTDAATNAVAFHIIEMAKELDLDMIAEGVENEAQAQALRERGVRRAQGWLFSQPLSLDELIVELDAPSCGSDELVIPT